MAANYDMDQQSLYQSRNIDSVRLRLPSPQAGLAYTVNPSRSNCWLTYYRGHSSHYSSPHCHPSLEMFHVVLLPFACCMAYKRRRHKNLSVTSVERTWNPSFELPPKTSAAVAHSLLTRVADFLSSHYSIS
jgi:hypothetical protein